MGVPKGSCLLRACAPRVSPTPTQLLAQLPA